MQEQMQIKISYSERIDALKNEMVKTLQELISIKSVVGQREGDFPFGSGVEKAFSYMLEKAKNDGFETENVDNYGGHIEFGGLILDDDGDIIGTSDEVMGIVGHLDVVPEGSDWKYDPYGGEIHDGKIYGRGTTDDKGPVVASYYAMKALKEAGIMPAKKVRLILGLDEETNWEGMTWYLSKVKAPDFGFTPDADFPAIHGEKGLMVFELAKKIEKTTSKGIMLRSVRGGNAPNMVADQARAVIRAESYDEIRDKAAAFRKETGYTLNVKGVGKSMEITTKGVSAHGAKPEQGLNAISILMKFLGEVGFANEDVKDFIRFYNEHIGFELDGQSFGCGFSDEPSGKLVLNVGTITGDSEAIILAINIRYPVTMNADKIYDAIMPLVNEYDFGIVKGKHQGPIYIPKDDPLIIKLMEAYRKNTGDMESEPIVIGGGTYARAVKNTVAFGARFPGEPELAHQKDEHISIDNLVRLTKIYADAIYSLTMDE